MNPAQWNRLKAVFRDALDQSPNERRAWLERACDGDTELLREAEALLASHESAGDFLETPAAVDPADVDALAPGARVGTYEILSEIGRGGMGLVYLAQDTRLGRRVALKALPVVAGADPSLRERLRREARAAATISHPAVATVYALEELDDQLFIVSEYVGGGTLRTLVERGPIEAARALPIASDIARALCAAHEAGVVHRDLKPENVLLTPDGGVKVVDFGIALVEGPAATRLTRSGALLGTPAYMAPEQLLGGAVDPRADLYSFGVMVKEMLTGRHPLSRPTPRESTGGTRGAVYARLMRVATQCMHADPDARFATARELLAALAPEVGTAPAAASSRSGGLTPIWWWEFHQALTALLYWLMTIPAWRARELIGDATGRTFFIVTLASVIVAANLRLHLWFTSRFYPAEQRWARKRVRRWIATADWILAAALVSGGLLIGEKDSPLAVLLISFGVGAAVAFLLIEPVTARAAFKPSPPRTD
jgi:serine/threonine protein kinase